MQTDEKLDQQVTRLEARPGAKFAQQEYSVLMYDQVVATARSKTMARRIANALNDYLPNSDAR